MRIAVSYHVALISGAALFALASPGPVSANGMTPQGYVGGGIGYYRVEDEDFPENDDEFEDEREAYKGFVGAMLTRHVGIEASYIDFAEASDNGFDADADGVAIAALGQLPLGQAASLYAKGGLLSWDIDVQGPLGTSADDDGEDPFYGFGARLGLAGALGLRLEYERFELDNTDVDLASANLEFRF